MNRLVLATGNKKKVAELNAMLEGMDFKVMPQSDFLVDSVPETGTTFVENAIIKARHAARVTGLPAIADDSGLEVDALRGAPGVYSARYAGDLATDEQNVSKLLDELSVLPPVLRRRFLIFEHNAAQIEQTGGGETAENGALYVVDSWFFDNGQPAVVMPLALWQSGESPNGAE